MPTYPQDSPTYDMAALLKSSTLTARVLADLSYQRFVTDRLLVRGGADQVASGSAVFSRSESIFPDRDVRELALRTQYPRSGWSVELKTAVVKKYGLEVPFSYESIRRNARDQLAVGMRKIANSLVRFVDTLAISMLVSEAATSVATAGAWDGATPKIRQDLILAKQALHDFGEGYNPRTLVIGTEAETAIMLDSDLGDLYLAYRGMVGFGTKLQPITQPVPSFMGFEQVLVTPSLVNSAIVMDDTIAGTVADEAPAPDEGYASFAVPGGGGGPVSSPIYAKTYDEEETDSRVVRGARWPAMWVSEPKAIYVITGVTT
jgi:hypothetical protein